MKKINAIIAFMVKAGIDFRVEFIWEPKGKVCIFTFQYMHEYWFMLKYIEDRKVMEAASMVSFQANALKMQVKLGFYPSM